MVENRRPRLDRSRASKAPSSGHVEGRGGDAPRRQVAAQGLAALLHVADLRAVVRRPVEGRLLQFLVGDGNVEPVAEAGQRPQAHLLLLVGDVHPLAGLAHAVALDRLGEDDRRLPRVLHGRRVGGVDLVRVVAAAVEAPEILVGQVGHHRLELRVLAEEVLAHEAAVLVRLVRLVLAVEDLLHALAQQPGAVAGEQRIPVRPPDQLDHVPAGAAEDRLEFLDDLAVAAHRPVEPLQVAVDDEDQVVELFARGEGDGAQGLGLVHLAVAHEGPDLAAPGVEQAPVVEVLHEPRLVDRHQRTEPHRDGRVLPEARHQPRMGIGRKAARPRLAPEAEQVLLAQAALQEGAGVDPRRGVALDHDQVAAVVVRRGVEEVVEADVVERGGGSEGRDVPAQALVVVVGAHHHRHRVPADDAADPPLQVSVARRRFLRPDRDRVQVGGGRLVRKVGAGAASLVDQGLEQEVGALRPLPVHDGLQGLQPLGRFRRVDVPGRLGGWVGVHLVFSLKLRPGHPGSAVSRHPRNGPQRRRPCLRRRAPRHDSIRPPASAARRGTGRTGPNGACCYRPTRWVWLERQPETALDGRRRRSWTRKPSNLKRLTPT